MQKYIFILAQDGDVTVDEVMAWLEYDGRYRVVRINNTDRIQFMTLSIGSTTADFEIYINDGLRVKLSQIHAYWYRRGQLLYKSISTGPDMNKSLAKSLTKYYVDELEHSIETLHFLLRTYVSRTINSFRDIFTNKLVNLECAKQAGLNVPACIVSNNPDDIRDFLKAYPKCIVKPIRFPGSHVLTSGVDIRYAQSTHLITLEEMDVYLKTHHEFQPTQFQEYIDKDFEVRTFVLNDKLFSMAIFSQQNEKTKIDFRNYDKENPNRNVPFQLPEPLEKQLLQCCRLIGLNCGSMDILYHRGQYYFLEINPMGQLQWLSHHCNYMVEKHISKTLIN